MGIQINLRSDVTSESGDVTKENADVTRQTGDVTLESCEGPLYRGDVTLEYAVDVPLEDAVDDTHEVTIAEDLLCESLHEDDMETFNEDAVAQDYEMSGGLRMRGGFNEDIGEDLLEPGEPGDQLGVDLIIVQGEEGVQGRSRRRQSLLREEKNGQLFLLRARGNGEQSVLLHDGRSSKSLESCRPEVLKSSLHAQIPPEEFKVKPEMLHVVKTGLKPRPKPEHKPEVKPLAKPESFSCDICRMLFKVEISIFLYLFFYLFIYLFIYLGIYPSIYISI